MGKLAFLFVVNWDLKDYGWKKKLREFEPFRKMGKAHQEPSIMGIL